MHTYNHHMDTKTIQKVARLFETDTEEIEEYLALDFEGEDEPTFEDLVAHIDYQKTVCQAEDPAAALAEFY